MTGHRHLDFTLVVVLYIEHYAEPVESVVDTIEPCVKLYGSYYLSYAFISL